MEMNAEGETETEWEATEDDQRTRTSMLMNGMGSEVEEKSK